MKSVALLTLLFAAPPAKTSVNDEAAKYEKIDEVRSKLKLITDGKGHYVAHQDGTAYKGPFFYSSDGKSFYLLRSAGGGAMGNERFNLSMWDPRIEWARNGYASIDFKDKAYSVSCPPKTTPMTLVADEEAKKLLEPATFYVSRWQRLPHKLARDDKGTYYFVDCARDEAANFCTRDWRLYVGPRGKAKLQQMTNIVSDTVGQIFSTKAGELRLVLDEPTVKGTTETRQALKWISGKETTSLVDVPVDMNARLIYMELGVYDRERLGTPCDDL